MARKEDHIVSVSLNGYSSQDLTITKSVSGWAWGNMIFGGLIGLAVDTNTGGLYKLTPEQLTADLEATAQNTISDGSVFVRVVLQPDAEWEKIGELERLPLTFN